MPLADAVMIAAVLGSNAWGYLPTPPELERAIREEVSPSPHHIEIAGSRYGLGPSEPARIDLVGLGLAEDALV